VVYIPLIFFGGYIGSKVAEIKVEINSIPRLIPVQVWYMKPPFLILIGSILSFGVVIFEFLFIPLFF